MYEMISQGHLSNLDKPAKKLVNVGWAIGAMASTTLPSRHAFLPRQYRKTAELSGERPCDTRHPAIGAPVLGTRPWQVGTRPWLSL